MDVFCKYFTYFHFFLFFAFVFFFIEFINFLYIAAGPDLPAALALCSMATAACILWACDLPDFLIFVTLALAVASSLNPNPWIVPFGSSSVYRSLCFLDFAFCPFLRGILLPSLMDSFKVPLVVCLANLCTSECVRVGVEGIPYQPHDFPRALISCQVFFFIIIRNLV